MLKMQVVAPIPSARQNSATSVNPGVRRSERAVWRTIGMFDSTFVAVRGIQRISHLEAPGVRFWENRHGNAKPVAIRQRTPDRYAAIPCHWQGLRAATSVAVAARGLTPR